MGVNVSPIKISSNIKTLESSLFNMVFVLALVTGIAGASLSVVYNVTKANILKAQQAKTLSAIKEVIPGDYTNNPKDDEIKVDEATLFPAMNGSQFTGAAVKTFSNKGYSGTIWLMVGLKSDGTIHKISVLEQKETPGLGTKMETPKFKDQFEGKNPQTFKLKVKKDGGDVDAITAATISSRAFTDAVQRAYSILMDYKKQKGLM